MPLLPKLPREVVGVSVGKTMYWYSVPTRIW